MRKNYALFLILFILFSSCSNPNHTEDTKQLHHDEQTMNNIVTLEENIDFLGKVSSFCFIEDQKFFVSTIEPSNIFLYSISGQQIMKLKNFGKGPLEFLKPTIIKYYNDKVYVWCGKLLKLIEIDKSGNPIKEFTNFNRAIKDFIIYKEYLILYMSGGYKKSTLTIWNLQKNKEIKNFGEPTKAHLLLNLVKGSGTMTLRDNYLYYSNKDKLDVYKIDLQNMHESLFTKIEDSDFQVDKIESTTSQMINNNRGKTLEYLNNNSIIKDIFNTKNHIIIKTEVGNFSSSKNSFDFSNRYNKYFFLDTDGNIIKKLIYPFSQEDLECLNNSFNNNYYSICLTKKAGNYNYLLLEIPLDK